MDRTPPASARSFLPTSTSLEDGVLCVASSRAPTSGTFRSISQSQPRSYTSTRSNIFAKMHLPFFKENALNTTPKKDASLRSQTAKVFSPDTMFCDSPVPSEHPSLSYTPTSNSEYTARKKPKTKRSFAKLLDLAIPGSTKQSDETPFSTPDLSSCSGDSDYSLILPPTPPHSTSPTTSCHQSDDGDKDDDSDGSDDEFDDASTLVHRRGTIPHHPFPRESAPYMQAYSSTALNNDYHTYDLLHRLSPPGSPTFHDYGDKPPLNVLDLGCGEGCWAAEAATTWKSSETKVTAFDLVDLGSSVRKSMKPDVSKNVSWMRGNFLAHSLPFKAESFDLVRMANLALAIPYNRWNDLLAEVRRVLKPGGRVEVIDDQMMFPEVQYPYDETYRQKMKTQYGAGLGRDWDDDTEIMSDAQDHVSAFIRFEHKARMTSDMENIFEKMLVNKYGVVPRPHVFLLDMLTSVFGADNADNVRNLKIAVPLREAEAGEGKPRRSGESDCAKSFSSLGPFEWKEKIRTAKETTKNTNTKPKDLSGPRALLEDPLKTPKAMRVLMGAVKGPKVIKPYQPTGLMALPSTFIPLEPDVLEIHACHSIHILLACKHALGLYVQELNDIRGRTLLTDTEFDDMIWEYDCFRRKRLNWPREKNEVSFDENTPEWSRRSFFHRLGYKEGEYASSKSGRGRSQSFSNIPAGQLPSFNDDNHVVVRTFHVFEAVKA